MKPFPMEEFGDWFIEHLGARPSSQQALVQQIVQAALGAPERGEPGIRVPVAYPYRDTHLRMDFIVLATAETREPLARAVTLLPRTSFDGAMSFDDGIMQMLIIGTVAGEPSLEIFQRDGEWMIGLPTRKDVVNFGVPPAEPGSA